MPEIITIDNNGQEITATNYWQTTVGRKGFFFLSINAGAFRLLVPKAHEGDIAEMLTGHVAIICSGPWPAQGDGKAVEILFEDYSATPYALRIAAAQCDRLPAPEDHGRYTTLTIWTAAGKQATLPALIGKATATTTATTATSNLTRADIDRAMKDIDQLMQQPEPIGEWMRGQGHPPEKWTLALPGPFRTTRKNWPDYVKFSNLIDRPVFVAKEFHYLIPDGKIEVRGEGD